MNRAELRRRAKEYNTPHKIEMLERQLRTAIKQEYEERTDIRMDKFIRAYTTLVIYVLWNTFGIGKKRMAKFSEELNNHLEILGDVKKYELTINDMTKVLKEEADIDLRFLENGKVIDHN